MLEVDEIVKLVENFLITTDRLVIQRFCVDDIDEEISQDTNPEVVRYIKDVLPMDEAHKRAQSIAEPWLGNNLEWAGFSIKLKGKQQMLGAVSFRFHSLIDETVEIGYRLAVRNQGQGYVTEAASALLNILFKTFEVHKVVAFCVEQNPASWNVMQKLGMQREGCLREYSQLNGVWFDELVYGILEKEYLKTQLKV
jgi:RimJ/RimL family protein N-acetyltransferase